ncbi:MAG TPA: hypothetical protein VFA22_05065, partial [Stellaceae bacterium]|nr:hypothetical protein [Stellaceae bacterium]
MNTLVRILVGGLATTVPAFIVLAILAAGGWLDATAALAAAAATYAGVTLVLAPLVGGVAGVRRALDRMAANEPTPEVRNLSPSVRELWLALGRWARSVRAELRARDAALEAAR